MAAELFVPPSKALDANANPYAGAKWFFYATGTTTPQSVYTTFSMGTAHANPVVADSTGKFANIFFDPALVYRGVLKNADESVTLHDIDPISSGTLAALAASGGSALVVFLQAGTGAVARTAQAKMRERVSVADFGATGDGVTNDTAAIQAAINYVQGNTDFATFGSNSPNAGPGTLFFPQGLYLVTAKLVVTKSISFVGDDHGEYSSGARLQMQTAATDLFSVEPIAQGCSVSWHNLSLRANGGGGTGGSLIHVTKTTATCNSIRISNMCFGTPQNQSVKIDAADDVMSMFNLYDASALHAVALGISTSGNEVSRYTSINDRFFSISGICVLPYNVKTMIFQNPTVYAAGTDRSGTFIDAANTLPFLVDRVKVHGGDFANVDYLVFADKATRLDFSGNTGVGLGPAVPTRSAIELTGACAGVTIKNNYLEGNYAAFNFIGTAGATVADANIGGNTIKATGGSGQVLEMAGVTGQIDRNNISGIAATSVGEKFVTTGSAVTPGTLAAGASYTFTKTVTGTATSDRADWWPIAGSLPVAVGIKVRAYCTANTFNLTFTNDTAGSIGPITAFDIAGLVTR